MPDPLAATSLGVHIAPLPALPATGVQRSADYTVMILTAGRGVLKTDLARYTFAAPAMMCFAPYQPFTLQAEAPLEGVMLRFHASFFCMHQYERVVTCNGVLFNNIYQSPVLPLEAAGAPFYTGLLWQMQRELDQPALGNYEILVSYLKVFLINLARQKLALHPLDATAAEDNRAPQLLQALKSAIEAHFRHLHAASDYAALLHITPRALARLTRQHFNTTMTSLIAERIVMEAKRELYLTNDPVKQIAYGLGFPDEYYFSRFFKKNAAVSPQTYRDTVGQGIDAH